MHCPNCQAQDTRVIDSRMLSEENSIRRRRKCDACEMRFTTYEKMQVQMPLIAKKDGRRENYNREKILNGLKKACQKRPISVDDIHKLINKVEKSALWVRNNLPVDILKPILVRGNPLNPETRNDECIGLYDKIVDRDRQWLMDKNSRKLNFTDKVIRAKENVQREIIKKISSTHQSDITCSGGRETAVLYPSGDIAGCEMRSDVLGNIRNFQFDFSKVWFSENADSFRKTVGKVKECDGCYHHCFISPAIFRTPSVWPRIAKSIMALND